MTPGVRAGFLTAAALLLVVLGPTGAAAQQSDSPWQKSPLHSPGVASRLTALFVGRIWPDMLPPHALSAGRATRLGATRGFSPRAEPAIEVYGFAGGYHFGNTSHVLKARRWAPAWGAGVFIPVSPNWGLLIDGVTSRLRVDEGLFGPGTGHPQVHFYEARRDLLDNSVTTQRLITLHPSFVRRWRVDRLSFYFGGGLAIEHQRQKIRYRRVNYFDETEREAVIASGLPYVDAADFPFSDETGIYALSERYTDSRDSVFATGLTARGGILVDVTRRMIVRVGYSYIKTYIDSPASQSVEVGVGYRF